MAQQNSWYANDLKRASRSGEIVDVIAYRDLSVQQFDDIRVGPIGKSEQSIHLNTVDALLVRTMPLGSLEQVIFRVNALHAAVSAGTRVFNSPRTLEIAIDKWLTLATVAKCGIETPRTFVCQSRDQALAAFEMLNQDVVVKPIFGGEGRGIMRVSCPDMAWRVFGTLEVNQSVIYLQEFVPHHGFDLRIFVLGNQTYAIKRLNPSDWRTNVARGGIAEAYHPSSQELQMALQAAQAVGGGMLGVDLLPARDGRLLMIEVNAVPGWKALARTLNIDMSRLVLDYMKDQAFH